MSDFYDWYAQYPRKVARQDAQKAYEQQRKMGYTAEIMLAGAKMYAALVAQKNIETKFIPFPASWLRAGRWLDDDLKPLQTLEEIQAIIDPSWKHYAPTLIKEIGSASFGAYFSKTQFLQGIPPQIVASTPFMASKISNKFKFPLERAFGEIQVIAK